LFAANSSYQKNNLQYKPCFQKYGIIEVFSAEGWDLNPQEMEMSPANFPSFRLPTFVEKIPSAHSYPEDYNNPYE